MAFQDRLASFSIVLLRFILIVVCICGSYFCWISLGWEEFLGWEDSLEKEIGNPLQYSCLENPMDRGTWQATVHGVTRVGHDLATKPILLHAWMTFFKTIHQLINIWVISSSWWFWNYLLKTFTYTGYLDISLLLFGKYLKVGGLDHMVSLLPY